MINLVEWKGLSHFLVASFYLLVSKKALKLNKDQPKTDKNQILLSILHMENYYIALFVVETREALKLFLS